MYSSHRLQYVTSYVITGLSLLKLLSALVALCAFGTGTLCCISNCGRAFDRNKGIFTYNGTSESSLYRLKLEPEIRSLTYH